MSVWLEGGKVNAVLYRSVVAKGSGRVLAAVLYADDGNLYLAFPRPVAAVAGELILPSPFVDRSKKRLLRFSVGSRVVTATGYLVAAGGRYDLDLLCEEVRFVVEASLGVAAKVRRHRHPGARPPAQASPEEASLFELAPVDAPEPEELAGGGGGEEGGGA